MKNINWENWKMSDPTYQTGTDEFGNSFSVYLAPDGNGWYARQVSGERFWFRTEAKAKEFCKNL